jgi:nucleoside-diphosphate-sugar epimerase
VFVHLVGTAKPAPWKGAEFRRVDLGSARQAGEAARRAGVERFVYVSVANPAPVMRSYIAVRLEAETFLTGLGLRCTFLRPWYVLGPGHWWPVALKPLYAAAERVPAWRETARRIGFVTHGQMVKALVAAVEADAPGMIEVPEIRRLGGLAA